MHRTVAVKITTSTCSRSSQTICALASPFSALRNMPQRVEFRPCVWAEITTEDAQVIRLT